MSTHETVKANEPMAENKGIYKNGTSKPFITLNVYTTLLHPNAAMRYLITLQSFGDFAENNERTLLATPLSNI